MLSMHSAEQYAIRVFRAGASGFLNKETATDELLVAVRRVLSGRKYITEYLREPFANDGMIICNKKFHTASEFTLTNGILIVTVVPWLGSPSMESCP